MDRGLTKRWAVAPFAVAMALAVVSASGSAEAQPPVQPITIGGLFSLTGLGNVYGPQQVNAARLAVAQINAAGGVNGAPLRLVVADDRSDPAVGSKAMQRLIVRDRVVAVIGPSLSLVAVRADPVADRLRTPVLAVSNTANGIVGKCAYPCTWVWRDSLGEAVAVPANVAAYVKTANPSTAALLATDDDVLGIDEADIARTAFAQAGVRVVANVRIPPFDVDANAITSFVKRAIAGKPKVLFIGTTFGEIGAEAIKVARAHGYRGAILGGNTMNSLTTTAAAGSSGAGARSGAAWYAANDFPANELFMAAYARAYGRVADQFAAQAYTGVEILANALAASRLATGEPIATARARLQAALPNVALTTPLGPFRFTSDHDVEQIVWILAMDGKGGHSLVDFCDPGC